MSNHLNSKKIVRWGKKHILWYQIGCALTCTLWFVSSAFASTGEVYGYGSKASALGNTMLAGSRDPYATFYNPAANSAHSGFAFSYAVTYANHNFNSIQNVEVANTATSSATTDQFGNVDTSYLDEIGQVVGLSFNLGEPWKKLTVGLTAFMPLTRVAYIDTGEAFLPEYFTYRSRIQRPLVYLSASAELLPHFHIAAGISFNTSLASKADLHLSTVNQSVSYARFSTSIKPGLVPYLSVYYDPDPVELGVTARIPSKANSSIDTNADARVLGPTSGLPLVTSLTNPIYYDPWEVDMAASCRFLPQTWGTVEVDWIQYSSFQSPAFTVSGTVASTPLQASVSNLPIMRDIWIPKIGLEQDIDPVTLRLGYFWRQSPIRDNSGTGNLVDPEKHVFTAGIGVDLKKAKITEKPISVDAHLQYHLLVTQHITKTTNNEAGTAGQNKVGFPGYDVGGRIFNGGLSVTISL